MSTIEVGPDLKIGDGCKPFIIAEVGSNWRDIHDCLRSIEAAKEAGADAVKFQLFNEQALYGVLSLTDATAPDSDIPLEELYARGSLRKRLPGEMPPEWIPLLSAHCDEHAIEFLCSAFSPELYDVVNPYVRIHKVASSEMAHIRILDKLKGYGKPVLLSTAGHSETEIRLALRRLGETPVVLMYCVGAYPARRTELWKLSRFAHEFRVPAGLSDHSTEILAMTWGTGACVIEKHFTVIPDVMTPDRPHSLIPSEFKEMVQAIRGNLPEQNADDNSMRLLHHRRLIALRDLKKGDVLKEGETFGIYRSHVPSLDWLPPHAAPSIEGHRVRVNIQAGHAIGRWDWDGER